MYPHAAVLTAVLTVAPLLSPALELALPLDSRPGPARSVIDASTRRFNGVIRRQNSRPDDAQYVADVPAPLKKISRTSLELRRGAMADFKDGRDLKCTGDFSLSLWIRPLDNGPARQTLLLHTGSWGLHYLRTANQLEFAVRGAESVRFPLPENARNTWSHLLLIRDGSRLRLRVNGVPAGTEQTLPGRPAPGGRLYLGAGTGKGANPFSGRIDELGLWNRALSEKDALRLAAGAAAADLADPSKLTRTITAPFPAELPVPPRPTTVEPVRNGRPAAVIAVQPGNRDAELAEVVQRKLADAWGVTFPIREVADHSDGDFPLILFGRNNSNMLTRELAANAFLCANTVGSELRVFPQVLDWKRPVLYFGGANADEVSRAVDRLTARFPRPAPLPMLVELDRRTEPDSPDALFRELETIMADNDSDKSRRAAPVLARIQNAYRDSCDERYAAVMGEAVSLMLRRYEAIKASDRNRPPTFFFHEIPQFLFLVENAPAFSPRHRRDAAELMRRFLEDTFNFWEMILPARMYAEGQTGYLTNHFNFAARSCYHAARYLLDRHQYAPARYWQAVANHVFAGVQDHPISPEDAAGYHFLVYRIFTNHALASGKYRIDFFQNGRYREAVDFAKLITNPLGCVPGYGDADAIGGASHYSLLRDALDILGDRECAALLEQIASRSSNPFYRDTILAMGLKEQELQPPPADRFRGLNAIALNDFLLGQHRRYPSFSRPVLNKAIFRGGRDRTADFLSVNGLTSAPHGHDDAAGIGQYIRGDRLWLFEGHYINRHAEDHNVLNVIRDGEAPDRRKNFAPSRNMAAQIVAAAQNDSRDFALLSLLLEDFNGVNQHRRIAWEQDGGFWLTDEAVARRAGDYLFLNQLRTTGEIENFTSGVTVRQRPGSDEAVPYRFSIADDGGSIRYRYSRRETCHGRPNTVLPGYRYSDGATRSLLLRRRAALQPGDAVRFFAYLTPLQRDAAPVGMRRIAANACLALTADFPRLAVLGDLRLPGVSIEAASCFIGPRGILAEQAKKIMLGDRSFAPAADGPTVLPFADDAERQAVAGLLARLPESAAAADSPAAAPQIPLQKFSRELALSSPVSALSVHDRTVAVGLTDGTFRLIDADGRTVSERSFGRPVSAVAFIEAGDRSGWAVGVRGPRVDSFQGVSAGSLHLLSPDGRRELWQKEIPPSNRRYGDIRTIFRALPNGPAAEPVIVAGSESWTYYAVSLDGRELWSRRCVHGATSGAAGDLNGDGRDEIFIGNEYYTHTILDGAGTPLQSVSASPHDVAAVILDLNGDGRSEVAVGRYDGYLYLDTLGDNPLSGRQLNLGGQPVNLAPLSSAGPARMAAAASSGVVTFLGPDLKPTARLILPAPIAAMAARGDRIYAAALDGFVYEVTDGRPTGRLSCPLDADETEPPRMAGGEQLLAIGSGRRLQLLSQPAGTDALLKK